MNRKSAKMHWRQMAFKADSVADDGRFSGYGSVFGVKDSYNEIVVEGAFLESLARIKESGDPLPALWQHQAQQPIGGFDILAEDARGLKVEGFLLSGVIPLAAQALELMKRRVVKGLSIGYYVEDSSMDEKTGIRTLKKLDLQEVSIVTFPANVEAQIEDVKHKLAHGSMPTLREFENVLRDAGFSKSVAARIATGGYKQLLDRGDSGGGEGSGELLDALKAFSLQTM